MERSADLHARGTADSSGTSPTSLWNASTIPPARNFHEELPRSASYTYMGATKDTVYEQRIVEAKSFTSEESDAKYTHGSDLTPTLTQESGATTPDEPLGAIAPPKAQELVGRLKASWRGQQHNQRQDTTATTRGGVDDVGKELRTSLEASGGSVPHRLSAKSFSKRFSRRQSWQQSTASTPSRSPSPAKQQHEDVVKGHVLVTPSAQSPQQKERRKSFLARRLSGHSSREQKATTDNTSSGDEPENAKPQRPSSFLRRKSTRDGNRLSKVISNTSNNGRSSDLPPPPAIPCLPKEFSTSRSLGPPGSTALPAPTLRLLAEEKDRASANKKKDELWSSFRSLDADYAKFTSKSSAQKASVVRTTLIPFLRNYASHPSNKMLRPEDLDRRANILNKWWTGLIEMLHGRNNQSISGTDRPIVLDGVAGIMERPEWRLSPSPFCPLKDRVRASLTARGHSSTSLASSSSDFLAESVVHNTRNIFVQNLTAQMAFVVEKMSSRHASPSLVAFCGKACAYAFMFVPGMADILSRIWELSMDTIRRVLSQHDVGKFDRLDEISDDVLANFPAPLHQLGFTSLMKMMRTLRNPPPLPLGTNNIQWWGPWLERWSGRESDLFYVFVKQYHFLAVGFLRSESTPRERLCAPGMLLVHAQILANLDATIHRDASRSQPDCSTPVTSTTFDDMLNGDPDAVASAIPVLPSHTVRAMAENRLIMLMRDFLSDRTSEHPIAREIFAVSFNKLLQAAVQGTSMFDHSACYTLLDLLEEALPILTRFEGSRGDLEANILDQDFWMLVYRKMIDSQNTLTEIRLYSFLYTVWNVIAPDAERKLALCTQVLLASDVFESRFNHWCPMVRAYYMRLLCWRVARYDGGHHDDGLTILQMMRERLQTTWAYHMHLCNTNGLNPIVAPCSPAPGRRFVIVRTDNQVGHANTFLSFDGILRAGASPTQSKEPPWKRASMGMGISLIDTIESRPSSISSSTLDSDSDSREKSPGIGGFLRKMIGSRSKTKAQDAEKKVTEKDQSASVKPSAPDKGGEASTSAEPASVPVFRPLTFKFSLEVQMHNRPHPPMRLNPPRLPGPAQDYLLASSANAVLATQPIEPKGESAARARYAGRALAEWAIVVGECGSFFERRKKEGAPGDADVETPVLGVEVFKRPG
ncbi:unnamed protein product [Zymoseptoria tritici ST99CH_3D1]|nr:unnamed protein product [Zymoseptoria tritici ST99CH_3D1]